MGVISGTLARATLAIGIGSIASTAFAAPAWPLRVSPDGRNLVDQMGRPFLITADAGWCMVNGLTDEQIDTYLDARQAQGFNAIEFMIMSRHSGCAVGRVSADRYGESPFVTGDEDWSVPNEAYWARVDVILDKLKARGLLALVTPAYLGFVCYYSDQGWCDVMSSQPVERMSAFGTFLGQRYRSQGNIIWVAGGDANTLGLAGMDVRVDALMSAITGAEAGRHLVTGHTGRHSSAFEQFGSYPWLTLNTAYDGDSCPDDTMAAQIEAEHGRTPVMPLLSIEQRFDAEGAGAVCLADQFLWAALGGTVGHVYGNGYTWTFSAGWDGDAGIGSPGALVHTNSAKLIRSRRYWLFVPDYAHEVVIAGYGSGTATVATSRVSTGETIMAYVPVEGTQITVDMSRLSGFRATAYWYDPETGDATFFGNFPTQGALEFVSPGDARVLVLDDASRGFPIPGSRDAAFRGKRPRPPVPGRLGALR